MRHLATAIVLAIGTLAASADEPGKLLIHEWGTFTSLQDETGRALGGINTDDEPVPAFVHRFGGQDLIKQPTANVVIARPNITMRLETPVVYFHPPRGATLPITLDFKATFRGGVLNEFYPNATAIAPDGPLQHDTVSNLTWSNLKIGVRGDGPATDAHVWLAPRNVRAAGVMNDQYETERYLFYRGVGHIDAPLSIASNNSRSWALIGTLREGYRQPDAIPAMWRVVVDTNGAVEWRSLRPPSAESLWQTTVVHWREKHEEHDALNTNLELLEQSLREALVTDGLFEDEADAMLATWEQSYFKSPGQRVFFIAPRAWVDRVLPLEVSLPGAVPVEITRVFVGRIELVTADQRMLLAQIKEGRDVLNAYRALGRFRDALVSDADVVEQVMAVLPGSR